MELKKYTVEEQKGTVIHWNYYYSKGIRTLEELESFETLAEERLDDLLRLIVLERFTDFSTRFIDWPQNYSLCNFLYLLQKGENSEKKINSFFEYVNAYFQSCELKVGVEEIVEEALKSFLEQVELDKTNKR